RAPEKVPDGLGRTARLNDFQGRGQGGARYLQGPSGQKTHQKNGPPPGPAVEVPDAGEYEYGEIGKQGNEILRPPHTQPRRIAQAGASQGHHSRRHRRGGRRSNAPLAPFAAGGEEKGQGRGQPKQS